MWAKFSLLFVLLCCLSVTGKVDGLTFESRDFDALVSEADQIVIGAAINENARRTGKREIVTDYRFSDLEIIKGTASTDAITLTMLGGTMGSESLAIAGAPTFQRGNRYLIFIAGNGSVMFPLVGGYQGIFQIRKDELTGVSRVHDHAGRSVVRLPGEKDAHLSDRREAVPANAMSEATFIDAIRVAIGKRRGQ